MLVQKKIGSGSDHFIAAFAGLSVILGLYFLLIVFGYDLLQLIY
ncbi:hypothetical protein [Halalkalibacter okhensis]|nr:hypothetical protein [Halalkalibacter okhensis]